MKVSFFLNRDAVQDDVRTDQTVLEYLREVRGLTGTKEACNEGDCGACVIGVGGYDGSQVRYRAMNSCLMPAPRLHGKHIVTVEGLADGDQLHPIQQAMVDQHAIQCGYCTPGMVMALFGLFQQYPVPTQAQIMEALDGSLCRCTGYAAIMKAALSVADFCKTLKENSSHLQPPYFRDIAQRMKSDGFVPVQPEHNDHTENIYFVPADLNELFTLRKRYPDAVLLNGGTDIMVAANTKGQKPPRVIDLSSIKEFDRITEAESGVRIGAHATINDVIGNLTIQQRFPALYSAASQMCSTPVRNSATVVGNICTASPIADTIPVLLIHNAEVVLQSASGTRRLSLREYFISYRKTALRNDEVLVSVEIPFTDYLTSFEKTGKRKVQDIASVNSAMALKLVNGTVSDIRLAYGGVAAVPFWAEQTCRFLSGRPLSEALIREAAEIIAGEITPMDDVRGSAEFRRRLAANHLIKHFARLVPTLFE